MTMLREIRELNMKKLVAGKTNIVSFSFNNNVLGLSTDCCMVRGPLFSFFLNTAHITA
jgi:hypothetical protein